MLKAFEQLPAERSGAIITAGIEEFSRFSYVDANTDRITAACGISKGLLYHYFGTKKEFYLYCVRYALELLTKVDGPTPEGNFYAVLFAGMEQKIQLCAEHPAETKLLNMASREYSAEVKPEKDRILAGYSEKIHSGSERLMASAVLALKLKRADARLAAEGLSIYAGALINRYLLRYQETPEEFFANKDEIKSEMKLYIDLMLHGICEEEK